MTSKPPPLKIIEDRTPAQLKADGDAPAVKKAHIEDLVTRMSEFLFATRNSVRHGRSLAEIGIHMRLAQHEFRIWCEDHGLELDWTDRDPPKDTRQ